MRAILDTRAARCGRCEAPCELQRDAVARARSDAQCPLRRWKGSRDVILLTDSELQKVAVVRHETPEQWGPRQWERLHRTCLTPMGEGEFRDWMAAFTALIANKGGCECRRHWNAMISATPPPWAGTPAQRFEWSVARHNEVNLRLKKPEMGVEAAAARWAATAD